MLQQRILKVLQLFSLCPAAHARSVEHKVVPKELLHQERLAHAPAAIHRNELRNARTRQSVQLLNLTFSADYLHDISFISGCIDTRIAVFSQK